MKKEEKRNFLSKTEPEQTVITATGKIPIIVYDINNIYDIINTKMK